MPTSLLEPESIPPPNPWPWRIAIAAVVLAILGGLLYWQFRYYPEKRQVERFMNVLVAGDYQQAYRIWNPPSSYTFQKFMEDWGETSSYGRIRSYEIVGVQSAGGMILQVPVEGGSKTQTLHVRSGASSGVIVSVRINGREPPERIWVERKDKRLSFPPY